MKYLDPRRTRLHHRKTVVDTPRQKNAITHRCDGAFDLSTYTRAIAIVTYGSVCPSVR